MGLSLWSIFVAGVLMANALAILHEDRFLAKRRWRAACAGAPRTGGHSVPGPARGRGVRARFFC
jgi:hypothetical protein